MKLEEALLTESLPLIKFKYVDWKNTLKLPNKRLAKTPRVQVLDLKYPGRKGQKTYGQREDVLGFNINYYKERRKGKDALDDIDSFARLLRADNKEKYKRIKDFYPDAIPYIRRYKKNSIVNLKVKKGLLWSPTSWDELEKINKEMF